jgi:uncharacterized protein (DUF2236 family)
LPVAAGRFPAGTRYSAEDPALVLWVHATLLESLPLVYELFVAPLTEGERDAYCAEAASTAIALGAIDADVPRTWAAARAYLEREYGAGTIAVSAQARQVAGAVLAPPLARFIAPAAWINRVVTLGLVPPHLRDQYGFAWTPRHQRAFSLVVPQIRRLRGAMPDRLATWPEARVRSRNSQVASRK